MHRSRTLLLAPVAGLLLLAGCAGEPSSSAPTGPRGAASPTAAAVSYGQSEMDAAALDLSDPSLAGFHTFEWPDDPGDKPETDPCADKWGERFDGNGDTATLDTGQVTFAQTDNVGPFVFQQQTIQPGTGAADVVEAARTSYLGACTTWTNVDGFTFTVTEQKDLGSVGDASFGYHVTISDATTDLEVMGIYMTKGNLLSHVEYAGSPDIEATKARAVLIAAGRLLPKL